MILAARKAGTFLGEAFMYRLHPQTAKIVDLVTSGAVGEVRGINASFSFRMGNPDPKHRLLANDTAGGGIMDICCYPVSMARLIAGAASGGAPFADPTKVAGAAHLGATGVDEWASAILTFPGDIIAEVSGGVMLAHDNMVRVFGTTGWFEVQSPWFASGRQGGSADIVVHHADGKDETITTTEPKLALHLRDRGGGRSHPRRQAGIRRARHDLGRHARQHEGARRVARRHRPHLRPREAAGRAASRSAGGRSRRPKVPMRRRKVPGIARDIAVVALGGANLATFPQAAILCDAYYEAGGNILDSAWLYGAGRSDRLFGDWMDSRGVRDDMLIIGKGAHSPLVYPDVIARQLTQSLDRLKTELHRHLFHAPRQPGRSRSASSSMPWTTKSPRAGSASTAAPTGRANAWTRPSNTPRRTASGRRRRSPTTSRSPRWSIRSGAGCSPAPTTRGRRGCASARSRTSPGRARRAASSPTAPGPTSATIRNWSTPGTARATSPAAPAPSNSPTRSARSRCTWRLPIVSGRTFPIIPLIGPLALSELDDSLQALDITLTPEDVRWLETGQR